MLTAASTLNPEAPELSTLNFDPRAAPHCRYGYQPQRIAVWIYWQAVRLLWRGAPFLSPPAGGDRHRAGAAAAAAAAAGWVHWQGPGSWPWSAQQGPLQSCPCQGG